MIVIAAPAALVTDIPVDPDAHQARQWMLDELSKPPYEAARPTWFDQLSQAFGEWLGSLRVPDGSGFGGLVPLAIVIAVVVLLVVAFLVFGRPRLNRRSQVKTGALFGADDTRSAVELRASAARAADQGDFSTAIQEAFRALARQLAERTIVTTSPGTTAHDFALRAGASFPSHSDELGACARLFDGVRYLDERGSREGFDRVTSLDRRMQADRPTALERIESVVVR
ncbi:DUF4129 domain-containing protein [Herbiconiux sp. CPCC 205763]|uniref:DUF4129 domain-containing protein n=1 Tax=Herbiconiux aconitum TaxID=2970913 RepID=A0ABT2GK31_9MICO|nr:DUF4129 domain-containing protein [Herbiconiux aconitum]MCS5716576.1 DUF4129 domain-containing protein [Herbiconiux aconitum]